MTSGPSEQAGDGITERVVEIRPGGKHELAENTETLVVRDTRANIEALVQRIRARETWVVEYPLDPKSAAETWDHIFSWDDDAPAFEHAPLTRPPVQPVVTPPVEPEALVPLPPPTPESVARLIGSRMAPEPADPRLPVLRARLLAAVTPTSTWAVLADAFRAMRADLDLAKPEEGEPAFHTAFGIAIALNQKARHEGD